MAWISGALRITDFVVVVARVGLNWALGERSISGAMGKFLGACRRRSWRVQVVGPYDRLLSNRTSVR